MSKKAVFTPGAMAALEKKAATVLKVAKDTVNPFAQWKGPLGTYYARLRLVHGKENKKNPSNFDLIFLHTCLARLPDSSSATATPDQAFAGETMRVYCSTEPRKGANPQTEQEAWDQTLQTIQNYDIKTSKFGMRDGQYNHQAAVADMAAALQYLFENPPAVLIEVTAGKNGGKFLNVRGVVDDKVVAKFGTPSVEITEDMIGELPDDEDNSGVPPVEELPDEDLLRKTADGFGDEALREMLVEAAKSGEIPLPEGLMFNKLPRQLIIDIGVAAQLKRALPDLSAYLPAPPSSVVEAEPKAQVPAADEDEEMPAPSIPDDDEEAPAAPSEANKGLMELQLAVSTEDRAALKKRLRNMGALRPEDKFTADQSDDFLRQWAIDVYTGVKPRLVAVAPTSVPFN